MKYVELGVHKRVFVERPLNPIGPVVEISEEEWFKMKSVHPSLWTIESGRIKAKKPRITPRWHRDLAMVCLGLTLGLLLRLL